MSLAEWRSVDPRTIQRQRWLRLAREEAEAAEEADEAHIAEAFRLVVATLELDRLLDPVRHGRVVLKGRQELHNEALRLAGLGLTARSVARVVGQPYGTVYAWLRKAGLARTRAEWRETFR